MSKKGGTPSLLVCRQCGADFRPSFDEFSPVPNRSFRVSVTACSCGHTNINAVGDPDLAFLI